MVSRQEPATWSPISLLFRDLSLTVVVRPRINAHALPGLLVDSMIAADTRGYSDTNFRPSAMAYSSTEHGLSSCAKEHIL